MTNLLAENIEIWTSAQIQKNGTGRGKGSANQNLYGIKKLRELILELAVRGKLVPQDPKEEPASVLLEKIAKEKARLIKEGKIKKEKPLPEISENEKPFELPPGWVWVMLQNLSSYIQRGKGPIYADEGRVQVISQKCIQWSGFDLSQARFVDDSSIDGYQSERFLENGDLLWNSTGTGTVGRINVLKEVKSKTFVADSHVTVIRPLKVNSNFLRCYVAAPGIQLRIEPEHEKSLVTGTTNQVELNTSAVQSLLVPVPPLAEQHCIVAKVDELMALCDKLEQQQADSNAAHQILVETLLAILTSAANANEFNEAWQRIAENFDTLFTTAQSIDQLKQTILQVAVMGKLVPQDPRDEPANVLLKKIATEKARLVKEGKIKKEKPLPKISEDEKMFDLPEGWAWSLIPQVVANDKYAIKRGPFGSSIKKSFFVPSGYKVYEQQHAINDDFSLGHYYIDDEKYNELKAFKVLPDDIIISCSGTVGRVAIAPSWMEPGIINQALLKLSLNQDALINEYFKLLFPTFFMKTETLSELQGTAQKNMVSVETLKEEPFPLPPIDEQHRIVAKVDELMAICDKLKDRLQEAQTTQIHLADAIVEQAVG